MIAISLKRSTLKRVLSRMRYDGTLEAFTSRVSLVSREGSFSYLYFDSLSSLCAVSILLASYNSVYVVIITDSHK